MWRYDFTWSEVSTNRAQTDAYTYVYVHIYVHTTSALSLMQIRLLVVPAVDV